MNVEWILSPGLPLIAGGLLLPLFRGTARSVWSLVVPVASAFLLAAFPQGDSGHLTLFGSVLTVVRVDKLSLIFGYAFHLAAFLAALYAFHDRGSLEKSAGLVYAGSTIGAAFAGDLITLFVFWELTAVSSVFVIWARGTDAARAAGFRYLVMQIVSGLLLLGGMALLAGEGRGLAFGRMELAGPAAWLVFLAFGVKCAFPLLHGWLKDAYPEASPTGTVFLSAFTTKLAVYCLARAFAGTDLLIGIGVAMALFPAVFAFLENDLRRVLSYSLNNQLGFMVVGVGIGTELALNGTAAHAFAHIVYKGLFFMAIGAVLHRTGTAKGSELRRLCRSMPWTTAFCIVAALSISAFPLFSGFVSKAMILTAAADGHHAAAWTLLLVAASAMVVAADIKVPFAAFFAEGGRDAEERPSEAPLNMLAAMGLAALICLAIGVYPAALYRRLPFPTEYAPFTLSHVHAQLQLLAFAALAFVLFRRRGWMTAPAVTTVVDVDWLYRRLPGIVWAKALRPAQSFTDHGKKALVALTRQVPRRVPEYRGVKSSAVWILGLLTFVLFLTFWYFLRS